MKWFRFSLCGYLVAFLLAALVPGLPQAVRAQAEQVAPFVECVSPDPNVSGASLAYFGYRNSGSSTVTLNAGTTRNQFIPLPANRFQPSNFLPGTYHFVFAVSFPNGTQLTWILGNSFAIADSTTPRCLTQAFTYQGRLVAGATPANGTFQMQFRIFDAAIGGNEVSPMVENTNVPVANGVFTTTINVVSTIDIPVAGCTTCGTVPYTNPYTSTAFLGNDRWLEISVKKLTDTSYTTLSPRQPITAAPYALHSKSATIAEFAVDSAMLGGQSASAFVFKNDSTTFIRNQTSQQSADFNISGNGTIGNTLTAGAISVSGLLTLGTLGTAGATTLCRNSSNQISTCSSSLRYKKDVIPFLDGLSLIEQLKPVRFKWQTDGVEDIGFGAEDVEKINPLFVTYNSKGEVEGIKYDRLTTVFVNALKEQQKQLETQQRQIEAQQKQLAAQQITINGLKQIICAQNPQADICRREEEK